ncbi:MAG TPA: EAL domain-containing protein, partial [Burkholderiaceae bacterium]|nr:EAL domain-containing protein [Burkholderiaceae bacterium]
QSGRHLPEFYDGVWDHVRDAGSWTGEVWCRDKAERVFPAWVNISTVRNTKGLPTHYVVGLTDITDRKRAEEEIKRLAYFDSLTELPNRQLLMDRLSTMLRVRATTHRHGAMLFIDLDHFKDINDTLGHAEGDRLLLEMARRLRANVREGDTVARFGGDEFVVLLDWLGDSSEQAAIISKKIGEKLLAVISQPFELGKKRQTCSASIGVAMWQGNQRTDAHELLKQADLAMYEAKKAGRNAVRFFDPGMQIVLEHRTRIEAQLRQALERGEFALYYQSRVDHRGELLGAEALLRWVDPERGVMGPADFIGVAEESALIVPLGRWVLEQACRQLARWAREDATGRLHLSVNISPRQFSEDSFVPSVLDLFAQTGADPALLELEITENLLLQDIEQVIAKMEALRLRGVRFALDDFGTGYSSLSYLHRLPISILKIDRAFVRDMPISRGSDAIVHTIVEMGQRMGMEVVAEGVETEEQKSMLVQRGCLRYQGFLFGRPVPIEIWERDHLTQGRAPSPDPHPPLLWQS